MKKFFKFLTLVLVVATIATVSAFSLVGCGGDEPAGGGDNPQADTTKIKAVGIELTEEKYAFGVAKENTTLLNDINTAYAALDEAGKIDEIMNAYFGGGTLTPVATVAEDKAKKDKQLVVATETGFAPFEYKKGNDLYGIDMAIMAEIAKKLNKELVVVDMKFDAVVTSVKTGLCDVAAAALTVTDKRKESINFSNTYYTASQVAIVKGDNTKFDACKTVADVENVLKSLPKGTKAAFQAGTTGGDYIKNYANLAPKPYDKVGLAATDLMNGGVDIIIVDKAPANAIVKSVNK